MKLALAFLLVCFLGSAATPVFSGIDLMALKKQEEERRKKLGKSKMAVNDNNVNTVFTGGKKYGFVQMESEEAPEAETAAPAAGKRGESPDKQPEYWKKQQDELTGRIDGLKADIEGAQLELNKLWSDFYIKNVASEQQAVREQIAQKTTEMEQKKVFLRQAEEQLEALFEKARKAGVPPGWLR